MIRYEIKEGMLILPFYNVIGMLKKTGGQSFTNTQKFNDKNREVKRKRAEVLTTKEETPKNFDKLQRSYKIKQED